MSFLGGLFGSREPDERFVDDQSSQEDYRDNAFVGHAIDQACTVYDTMFNALEYAIKGRANVIEQMDRTVSKLEAQCNKIVEKYKEILGKLADPATSGSLDLSLDLAKDAFRILNANPILRRYIGEANYWMLWDTLAVLSGKGVSASVDFSANIKNAIKGTIYAMLSMTNGMMHFESYISQITQFWGWLYMKEIWLPLTGSICPQVTCQYYYRTPMAGNPIPGPANYAPAPVPVFDYVNYSPQYIAEHFRYSDPNTWDVLVPESRARMQRAYNYWKSNYTNEIGVANLMPNSFGARNGNYPGGAPLKVGATFHQLDASYGESFPVSSGDEDLADAFAELDAALIAFNAKLADPALIEERDAAILAATVSEEYPDGASAYTGAWRPAPYWNEHDWYAAAAGNACAEVVADVEEFRDYVRAIARLSTVFHSKGVSPASYISPPDTTVQNSPMVKYLVDFYADLAERTSSAILGNVLAAYNSNHNMAAPYAVYSPDPDPTVAYTCAILWSQSGMAPLYSAGADTMSYEVDADGELGRKADGGREPLFAALGVYGDLKGLYPWEYRIVPLESFRQSYTKIKGSYHIYYRNSDPSRIIFADRVIQAGLLKYIATCKASAMDTITRGSETYTAYIFPSETCAVYRVPDPGTMFGAEWPSFASLQRVDAVDPSTGAQYMYDLARNQIPRYPKYVDSDKWSIMDLIHELWLLADSLAPICGDGGMRRAKLNDLLNQFGLNVRNGRGPMFIGQLPQSAGQGDVPGQGTHVELEFNTMNEFASRIKAAIDAVYGVRDEVLAATRAW